MYKYTQHLNALIGVCENKFCVRSLQSCPTLYDPMDCKMPAPLSRGFSRQKYWSGLPFPPSGDLPNPGT